MGDVEDVLAQRPSRLRVYAAKLVTMMWGALGVLLALAFRSIALPIGLGLVWMLAVQNLIASIAAPLLDWVAEAGQATLVLAAYLVAFCVFGGWLLQRRDIA